LEGTLLKKKKAWKLTGIVLGTGLVFSAGALTEATTDWVTNALNSSYSRFLDTASGTTNDIVTNADQEINTKIQTEIENTVVANEDELKRMLEEYYQMKLNGLTESEDFKSLEAQLEQIRNNVFESYKLQIDEAFAGQ
jgi:hypothetical protein